MPDQKLSQLTAATTPLTGAELVYAVQSGNSRKTTVQAIADKAPGTDLTYTAATRTLASSTGADAVLPEATTTTAGLESAADKTKLDSITVDTATVVRKYVRNNSGVLIPKGAAVYQTGSSGTTLTVALADASTEATASQTLGLAQEAIGINANGYVVAVGLLDGVSTATLTEGQIVWLSETAGQLTTTRPTQPAHGVVCGYCVKQAAGTAGILYVKVDNGLELAELHDVLVSGATTGQVLRLASDGLWKNHTLTPADVGGHDAVTLGASVADVLDLTGQVLGADDPGADRILFWDDSEGKLTHLQLGTNLSITGTTLDATGGGAGTDLSYTASSRLLASSTGADVTLPLMSSTEAGLVPPSGGGTTNFLRADGTFAAPPGASTPGVYAVGNWISPVNTSVAGGTAVLSNQIFFHPFVLSRSITVSDLGARVTTASAGSDAQFAIYASSSGEPIGAPLATTASLSVATATTIEASVTPFNLTAGQLYWMAVIANSSSPAFVSHVTSSSHNGSIIGAPTLSTLASAATIAVIARNLGSQTLGVWPTLTAGQTNVQSTNRGAIVFLKVSALL
jgi:hypothetical protein